MIQKIITVGSSIAVTIPKKASKELGFKAGDSVSVHINAANRIVSIQPAKTKAAAGQTKIAKLTLDFVNRYREDLEALAR